MAFKLVVLLCAVAAAQAGVAPVAYTAHPAPVAYAAAPAYHAAPVAYAAAPVAKVIAKTVEEYDTHPQYTFSYDVQDGHTGDSKSQTESRDGDVVHGSYSLVDPDGVKRTVEYTSDPHNGFNAVVHREPLAHAPVVAKVAAPVVAKVAAPVAYHAAPVAYQAAPVVHAAPVAYQAAPVVHAAAPVAYAAPQYYHH